MLSIQHLDFQLSEIKSSFHSIEPNNLYIKQKTG